MFYRLLLAVIIVSAVTDMVVAARLGTRARYVSKPATTILIGVLVAVTPEPVGHAYQLFLIAGLLFSVAGDILLIDEARRLKAGVGCFLVAHLWYSAAFVSAGATVATPLLVGVALAYGVSIVGYIWPHAKGFRGPAVAYTAVVLIMALLAGEAALAGSLPRAGYAAVGAVLFVISDSLLSINHFARSIPAKTVLVMTTYVAAQLLIAMSAGS